MGAAISVSCKRSGTGGYVLTLICGNKIMRTFVPISSLRVVKMHRGRQWAVTNGRSSDPFSVRSFEKVLSGYIRLQISKQF